MKKFQHLSFAHLRGLEMSELSSECNDFLSYVDVALNDYKASLYYKIAHYVSSVFGLKQFMIWNNSCVCIFLKICIFGVHLCEIIKLMYLHNINSIIYSGETFCHLSKGLFIRLFKSPRISETEIKENLAFLTF